MKVYENGGIVDADAVRIAPDDRGLRYGDGIFETLRVRDSRVEFARAHVSRLLGSATALEIDVAGTEGQIIDALRRVVGANGGGDLVLRIDARRGAGGVRLDTSGCGPAEFLITASPYAPPERVAAMQGLKLATCSFPRNERSPLSSHKTANYMESILARAEAARKGADEAIFLNTAGRLAEAAAANIFLVSNGRLITPSCEEGALPGIVRAATIRAAHDLGIPLEERPVDASEPPAAAQVFITNSLIGLASVASIDGRPLPNPAPGEAVVIPGLRIRVRELAIEDSV